MNNLSTINKNLPAFMQEEHDLGVADMKRFIVPPRLKIVQPLSKGVYAEKFNPGDLVMTPAAQLIIGLDVDAKKRALATSQQVIFTPLFFFAEFCAWNPLETRGNLPAIRERSFDENSMVAKRCRDANLRFEPCPEMLEKNIRFVEHLNFLIQIHTEDMLLPPVIISFSKAEHTVGRNFMNLIMMRRAPIYGCKFAMNVAQRENQKGVWFGLDVDNPPEAVGGFIDNIEMFNALKAIHLELKAAHNDKNIVVDFDDDDEVEGSATPSEM
jgi:hypothetical protein